MKICAKGLTSKSRECELVSGEIVAISIGEDRTELCLRVLDQGGRWIESAFVDLDQMELAQIVGEYVRGLRGERDRYLRGQELAGWTGPRWDETEAGRRLEAIEEAPALGRSPRAVPRADQLRFRRRTSYLGSVYYEVRGDGLPYRVEVRSEASATERSIYNGDEFKWQRDVVASIGLIRRSPDSDCSISQRVVDAFNAWRAAEHVKFADQLRSRPGRHANIRDDDPRRSPPVAVRGAHYEFGKGWIVNAHTEPPPPESVETGAPSADEAAAP